MTVANRKVPELNLPRADGMLAKSEMKIVAATLELRRNGLYSFVMNMSVAQQQLYAVMFRIADRVSLPAHRSGNGNRLLLSMPNCGTIPCESASNVDIAAIVNNIVAVALEWTIRVSAFSVIS